MPVYRRKPGRIDAVQWLGKKWCQLAPSWVVDAVNRPKAQAGAMYRDEDEMIVVTPDGERTCKPGDYVILRGNGDLHVLSGEVFQQCFERDQ